MGIFLAWHNTFFNKKRTLAAVAGITFSILLLFMELGFLDTVRRSASLVYKSLDFDFILVNYDYEYMNETGRFNRGQLIQAMVTPGVHKVAAMDMAVGQWEDTDTEIQSSIMILGIPNESVFILDPLIKDQLDQIDPSYTVMLDRLSNPSFGSLAKGREEAKINRLDVTVSSVFNLGMGFYADGAAISSPQTFAALTRLDPGFIRYGLIKAVPGENLEDLKHRLQQTLSPDVMIFDRQEMIVMEEAYFVNVMPIGIMVRAGVVVAFLVGAVILFQVLSTEITNRLDEFATLKAAGFTNTFVYGVGFQQAFIFCMLSYGPALVFAHFLFKIVHQATRLPSFLTMNLSALVLALSLSMCLISGFLALRKVKKADPADLF
jgi:putative ABC transport system permease protein